MLEGLTPTPRKTNCKVKTVLDGLEQKDRQILLDALQDPSWPTLTLANSLSERGVEISESPIRRHRLGRCSCA
jgi:hypothetical protein